MVVAATLVAYPVSLLAQPLPEPPPLEEKVPVVVLDPGRGGSNVGGSGATGLLEKDVTLQLATEAARLIGELLGVQVILTRTDDSDVSIEARAVLANQSGGNLFISLYAGGSLGTTGQAFQTFYFDDRQERPPSKRERVHERDVADDGGRQLAGTGGPPRTILWDQAQLDFLDTSQMLARILDKNLRAQVGEEGRGVFGLPILLLRWVHMPAVLLDIGAINDPGFEAKLREDAYLQRAALGIAQAVNDYLVLQR
jgi:N-acetylmuramoyl-L-alanine amidase